MKEFKPNPEQKQAINHLDGPILVVAGAGTGKTAVIAARIANLIQNHQVKPEEVLALTFTEKAAREMEGRVDQILPLGVNTVRITTFNGFGHLILQEYGIDIGLPVGLKLITKAQQIVLLRDHIDELGLDYFALKGSPSSLFGEWLNYFSSLRNELIDPPAYLNHAYQLKSQAKTKEEQLEARKHLELASAYQVYAKLKQQKGLIDYDDQIYLSSQLLKQRPNVTRELKNRYRYIMVDEFQDTNLAQNHLLELLSAPSGNIMVVGDDDQSIYKFRGAAVSNILAFSERFKHVERVVLTRNYRSTQSILDAAYDLIQHNNPDRLEFKYNVDKRLKGRSSGHDPKLVIEPTIEAEARWVAGSIKKLLDAGADPGEIAVLVRKHRQLENLVGELRRLGIPHSLNTSAKLFHQAEVLLLLSFLQFIADPDQSEAVYHLLQHQLFGIDQSVLASKAARARSLHEPLYPYLRDNLEDDSPIRQQFLNFYQLMIEMRQFSAHHNVLETVFEFLTRSGLKDRFEEQAEADPAVVEIFKNLELFLQNLIEFQGIADDKSCRGYIHSLGALRDLWQAEGYQESDFGQGEIKLMTIHQSKGLEFENVFLFDLNQGDFPGASRPRSLKIPDMLLSAEILPEGDWHIQEERRLIYVAATRAKKRLYASFSPDHSGTLRRKPSIFLKELFGEAALKLNATEQLAFSLDRFGPTTSPAKPLHHQLLNERGQLVLTPHQIDDYLTCPYNFRHRYLLHVPEDYSTALMYGNVLHKIINQYFILKRKGEVELAVLTNLLEELWDERGFESRQQQELRYQQARSAVEAFYRRYEAANLLPQYTEERVEFEIPEANLLVRGRLDAVFEQNGEIEIRDYKTSFVDDPEKADLKAKKSVQLSIYALAWRYRTGRAPDKLVLDYVNTGEAGVTSKTSTQLDTLQQKILGVADGIRNEQFPPKGNHLYCSHRPISRQQIVEALHTDMSR